MALLVTGALAYATPSLAQTTLNAFVDPDSGTDTSATTGTVNDPFKTMTFALSAVGAGSLQTVTLHLEGGVYSGLGGEQFPIIANSGLVLTAVTPGTVFIDGIRGSAPGADGFVVTGNHVAANGFRMRSGGTCFQAAGDVSSSTFEDLVLDGDGAIDLSTNTPGFVADFSLRDCVIEGSSFGVAVSYTGAASLNVSIDASTVSASEGTAVQFSNTGALDALMVGDMTNSVLYGSTIGMQITGSQRVTIDAQNCTFCGNGKLIQDGEFTALAGGSLFNDNNASNTALGLRNCLFSGDAANRNIPDFTSGGYFMEHCVVQQASPVITGTNIIMADAPVADAAGGDYHILPFSDGSHPAIGQALVAIGAPAVDLDGDARNLECPAGRDIGADEYVPNYHYFVGPVIGGQSSELRAITAPNANAGFYLSGTQGPLTSCISAILGIPTVFLGGAATDALGLATASVVIPATTSSGGASTSGLDIWTYGGAAVLVPPPVFVQQVPFQNVTSSRIWR